MRIGLYGMPCSGKSFLMDRIDFMEVFSGSQLLHNLFPNFETLDESGKKAARQNLANIMYTKQDFIMDGHYAFGDITAFTVEDGTLYDVFIYLYIDSEIIKERMKASDKNRKYLQFDIAEWQKREIKSLREYCHKNNKDFYVLDNPPENFFIDVGEILQFIREIQNGFSCIEFSKKCAKSIVESTVEDTVILMDGDKTLTVEDSSSCVFGYKTHLYDGNFYTGYQSWKQSIEFSKYNVPDLTEMPVNLNQYVLSQVKANTFILTSGHDKIWSYISQKIGIPFFQGIQMSAETKYFIVKFLQDAGKIVIAFGDGMNDYYMLKQANTGYLIRKQDGKISRSLKNCDLEGLVIV